MGEKGKQVRVGQGRTLLGVEGPSGSESKDSRLFSVTHPAFLLLLLIAQSQMSLGNTSWTGTKPEPHRGN